jgi:thiamine-monophosphate kinase
VTPLLQKGLIISITAFGEAGEEIVYRNSAKETDLLVVTEILRCLWVTSFGTRKQVFQVNPNSNQI